MQNLVLEVNQNSCWKFVVISTPLFLSSAHIHQDNLLLARSGRETSKYQAHQRSTAEPLEHEGEKTKPTRVSLTDGKSETNTKIRQQNLLPITKSTLTSTQSGRTQSTPPNLGSTYATLLHASAKQIHFLLSTKLLSPLAQEDSQDVFPSRASVHGVRLLLREAHGAWRVAPAIRLDPLRPNRRRNLF